MKFRLRTLFFVVTVIAGICYALTAPPNIYMLDPHVLLSQNTRSDMDEFGCKLVNRGVFPIYILAYNDYSDEMTVFRPKRADETLYFRNEWRADFDLDSGPTLKPPLWKQLYSGDSIHMSGRFRANHSDRRVKIYAKLTDWLGRSFEILSEEMKHDASGTIKETESLQNNPMDTKRRIDRF